MYIFFPTHLVICRSFWEIAKVGWSRPVVQGSPLTVYTWSWIMENVDVETVIIVQHWTGGNNGMVVTGPWWLKCDLMWKRIVNMFSSLASLAWMWTESELYHYTMYEREEEWYGPYFLPHTYLFVCDCMNVSVCICVLLFFSFFLLNSRSTAPPSGCVRHTH